MLLPTYVVTTNLARLRRQFCSNNEIVGSINYTIVTIEVINIEFHGTSSSNWSREGFDVEYWMYLTLMCSGKSLENDNSCAVIHEV